MTTLERIQRSVIEHLDEMKEEDSTYVNHDQLRDTVGRAVRVAEVVDVLARMSWDIESALIEVLMAVDDVDGQLIHLPSFDT